MVSEFYTKEFENVFVSMCICKCVHVCKHAHIHVHLHLCTHISIKNPGVPLPDVHITVLGFPLSQSVHLCHADFTSSAPHSVLIYPIFSLSSDSPSLAVPPGGCSAQNFLLSWIFTIALQFTFTKINSPMWNFCNQHRDQNKQIEKQSRQQFSSHVNCSLRAGEKNGHHPNHGPCTDALLLLSLCSPVYPI